MNIKTFSKINQLTIKMSTSEEVFALYEKNQLFDTKKIIEPLTIGDPSIPCRFSVKTYIRPGEECAICLDKIQLKKDAYLTGCGHAFHRSCLFKTLESKWREKLFRVLACPLCRCKLGIPEFLERYAIQDQDPNHLDIIENFWLTKDFLLPHFCSYTKKKIHYLGMSRCCKQCKEYQEKG
jgi:hypothetical protein